MHIGMFADMYLPHVSGVTNHIRLYKAELERQGHEVTLFTFGDRTYPDAEPGVIRSPAIPYGDTGWNVPLGLSREAVEAMDRIDIAHAHHPFASCLSALRCRTRKGTPTVFTNHTRYDLYSDTYAGWIPAAVRHGSIQRYLTWLNGSVSLTISPSAHVAEWLGQCGAHADKLISFPNAIDTGAFAHPPTVADRDALGLPDDAFVVCYVGRVAHEKNVRLLVDAFAQAAIGDDRLALVMVGDGPARAECEQAVAASGLTERVRFLGLMPYHEVPGVLHACDAFATASVSEMYPLVVVEACAAGLPVLGITSPGVAEIIEPERSGLLCREDVYEFAEQIRRAAADAELMDTLRAGAAEVANAHDLGTSAARLVCIYEELIARGA